MPPAAGRDSQLSFQRSAAPGPGSSGRERWEIRWRGTIRTFEIEVTVGKPFDVVGTKWTSLADLRAYAEHLRATASAMYGPVRGLRRLERCPCCDALADPAAIAAEIYGARYLRCVRCGHAFVGAQPTPDVLNDLFGSSDEHASAYTDDGRAEQRIEEIIRPKLDWISHVYQRHRGRSAKSVLDVGAGGGHFLALCARRGMSAVGYEVSSPARRFAQRAFGLSLRDADFLTDGADAGPSDLVTFWGLLEYTPDPLTFLREARRRLDAAEGMLVVEVPRFDCVGTFVQRGTGVAARHLDPTSHMNLFSDASVLVALLRAGFAPVAAWYFGMDAYELLAQLALSIDDRGLVERAAPLIRPLQASLDAARLCDDLVVAALPNGVAADPSTQREANDQVN